MIVFFEMPMSRRMPTVSFRSSARITINASRNAVLPITVTTAMAVWKRSMTRKVVLSWSRVALEKTNGVRADNARENVFTLDGSDSATLIVDTASADEGFAGSAERASRSSRCSRASIRSTLNFIGSGVGS